jgi:hypothetical protein
MPVYVMFVIFASAKDAVLSVSQDSADAVDYCGSVMGYSE